MVPGEVIGRQGAPDAVLEDANVMAILLFGSRARRDESRGSDTDLLLIVPSGEPRHVSWDNFSVFLYTWPKLLEDAAEGDLFVCHLVREARAVLDPADRLGRLRTAFRLRDDYSSLIQHACDLGWFLERFGADLNPSVVARRMIWCVRTLLIAKSAQAGIPTFAPHALGSFSTSPAAAELLAARHQQRLDGALKIRFRRFMTDECRDSSWHRHATKDDFVSHFADSGNAVALQTLKQSEGYTFYS